MCVVGIYEIIFLDFILEGSVVEVGDYVVFFDCIELVGKMSDV